MNPVIHQLQNHYSIRDFQEKPLSTEQIQELVKSAQAASTSSFIQAYSIIGINDIEKRKKLSAIAGNQPYVVKTGQFFVFVADLARHERIAQKLGSSSEALSSTEKMLVAIVDASLAAQNMAVAAESMGLGVCFIGGIRNAIEETADILELPPYTIPLFGLTVGYPVQSSKPKPRLPEAAIYHEDSYQFKDDSIAAYDETIQDYYQKRTNGDRVEAWSEQISRFLERPSRLDLKQFIEKQQFMKK